MVIVCLGNCCLLHDRELTVQRCGNLELSVCETKEQTWGTVFVTALFGGIIRVTAGEVKGL